MVVNGHTNIVYSESRRQKQKETLRKSFENGRSVWNKGKINVYTKEQLEKLSDKWLVRFPDGNEVETYKMSEFCKLNSLNPSTMSAVARGYRSHHKGFWCKKLTHVKKTTPYENKAFISVPRKKNIHYLDHPRSTPQIVILPDNQKYFIHGNKDAFCKNIKNAYSIYTKYIRLDKNFNIEELDKDIIIFRDIQETQNDKTPTI